MNWRDVIFGSIALFIIAVILNSPVLMAFSPLPIIIKLIFDLKKWIKTSQFSDILNKKIDFQIPKDALRAFVIGLIVVILLVGAIFSVNYWRRRESPSLSLSQPSGLLPIIIPMEGMEEIPVPASAEFSGQQYYLATFFTDGVSKEFLAPVGYVDISVAIDYGEPGKEPSLLLSGDYDYDSRTGKLILENVLPNGAKVLFWGTPQNL